MVPIPLARGWDLQVERGPEWLFVRPHRVDRTAEDSPAIAEHVWAILEQSFGNRLVLEMGDFDCLDSHLVGELLWLYRKLHARDGMMRICGLSSENQALLKEFRLEERFPPYRNREDAVMNGSRPSQPR